MKPKHSRVFACTLLAVLLVGTIPTLASAQTLLSSAARNATGTIPPIWPTNVSQHGWPTNNLVVDTSGSLQLASSQNIGANLTDISVIHVPASTPGFSLHDPLGRLVFANQPSRSDGTVVFWHVNFYQGVWAITRQTTLGTVSVTAINTASFPPSYPVALSPMANDYSGTSGSGEVHNPNPQGPGGCFTNYQYTETDDKWAYTPTLIVHAPYDGAGTADTTWMHSDSSWVADMGMESDKSTTAHLSTTNGQSTGDFVTAHWASYQVSDANGCDPVVHTTTKVVEWGTTESVFSLQGSDARTDSDDATSVDGQMYYDLRFNYYPDATYHNFSNATLTIGASSQTLAIFGAQIDFSAGPISFDGVSFKSTDSSGNYYTYTLNPNPAPSATWEVQHLVANGTWATCRADLVSCAPPASTRGTDPGVNNTPPAGWTYCATDGGVCNYPSSTQPYDIAYGYGNYYAVKTGTTGGVACTADIFGWDPAPGQVKTCYENYSGSDESYPGGWSYCTSEGHTCTTASDIAYGANSNFVVMTNEPFGSYSCSNSGFGHDPASGYVKNCYYD